MWGKPRLLARSHEFNDPSFSFSHDQRKTVYKYHSTAHVSYTDKRVSPESELQKASTQVSNYLMQLFMTPEHESALQSA